ncbi:MAG: DMT family transporter, partial [Parcubacteria group bacterium]
AFSFGSSTTFSKKAITKVSHGMGTALRFYLTTLIMLIIISAVAILKASGVHTMYAGFVGFQALTWEMMLAFAIIALTTGGTAIFIYYWGLKRVTATRSTIYELMFPVSAIILEYFIHDKILNLVQWLGAVMIMGAIFMVVNYQRKSEVRPIPHSSGSS